MANKKKEAGVNSGVAILIAVVLLVGIIVIGNNLDNNNEVQEKEPMQTRVLELSSDILPANYRDSFLEGCVGTDFDMYDYCSCALDYLDENYTNKEIIKDSYDYADQDEVSDMFFDAMSECLYLL